MVCCLSGDLQHQITVFSSNSHMTMYSGHWLMHRRYAKFLISLSFKLEAAKYKVWQHFLLTVDLYSTVFLLIYDASKQQQSKYPELFSGQLNEWGIWGIQRIIIQQLSGIMVVSSMRSHELMLCLVSVASQDHPWRAPQLSSDWLLARPDKPEMEAGLSKMICFGDWATEIHSYMAIRMVCRTPQKMYHQKSLSLN